MAARDARIEALEAQAQQMRGFLIRLQPQHGAPRQACTGAKQERRRHPLPPRARRLAAAHWVLIVTRQAGAPRMIWNGSMMSLGTRTSKN